MRSFAAATLLILAAGAQAQPVPAMYEHHDVIALERSAREHLRAGDRDTACILIDRAARISPHDRRIAANIVELEFAVAAASTPVARAAPAPVPAPSRPPAPAPIAPEPPALWPLR